MVMTNRSPLHSISMDTPVGTLTLVAGAAGLVRVLWPGESPHPDAEPGTTGVLRRAAEEITAYFGGTLTAFSVPLDLAGTPFQLMAWRALATIPYGTTVSYTVQARRIGCPRAVRAIGAANARNPVPIVLPCHRVVGANGDLTGFGGGLPVKRALMEHEAVVLNLGG